jgi:hypothetical protein
MKTLAFLLLLLLGLPRVQGAVSAADDNPPESKDALAAAVTASNWSWEDTTTGMKRYAEIQFYEDGSTRNSKFSWVGHWEASGPRVLVLENVSRGARWFGQKCYLVFDAGFTHFIGFDFNGRTLVEGFRREAVDPKRQAPAAKEE